MKCQGESMDLVSKNLAHGCMTVMEKELNQIQIQDLKL